MPNCSKISRLLLHHDLATLKFADATASCVNSNTKSDTNLVNEHNMVKSPNWQGGRPVGYLPPRLLRQNVLNGTRTRDLRISSPALEQLVHATSLIHL